VLIPISRAMLLCALAPAFALSTVGPAAARPKPKAVCSDRLCLHDRAGVPSCVRFHNRSRVVTCYIVRAARHYGQPPREALAIARRESRLNPHVTNRRSGAAGLFQFMPGTWRHTPYRHRSPYSVRWAPLAAMWMWRHGEKVHWAL
jgi:hypothetical protein